jgi:hypothetical protein
VFNNLQFDIMWRAFHFHTSSYDCFVLICDEQIEDFVSCICYMSPNLFSCPHAFIRINMLLTLVPRVQWGGMKIPSILLLWKHTAVHACVRNSCKQFSAPRVDTQQIWKKFCGKGFFYSWHLILKTTVDQSATKQIMFSANLRKLGELWLIRTDRNKCYIYTNSKVFTLLLEKQTVAGKREITEKFMLLIIPFHF